MIEIALERARPDGCVDAAAATDDAPHMFWNRTVVRAWRGDRRITPIALGAEVGEPDARIHHGRRHVPVSGLDHQNRCVAPECQPAYQGTCRGAGPDDNIVVRATQLCCSFLLVCTNCIEFVGKCGQTETGKACRRSRLQEAATIEATGNQRPFKALEQSIMRIGLSVISRVHTDVSSRFSWTTGSSARMSSEMRSHLVRIRTCASDRNSSPPGSRCPRACCRRSTKSPCCLRPHRCC